MTLRRKFEAIAVVNKPFVRICLKKKEKLRVTHLQKLPMEEKVQMGRYLETIYKKLAHRLGTPPQSKETQQIMNEWYHFLANHFGSSFSLNEFKKLGYLYVKDERLKKNIDKYGEGLAEYMKKAIMCYISSNPNETTG